MSVSNAGERAIEIGCRVGRVSARRILALPEIEDGECFVTSVTDGALRVYPIEIWAAVEARVTRLPTPAAQRFAGRVAYYGFVTTLKRGTLALPARLRDMLGSGSDVVVTRLPDGSFAVSGLERVGAILRDAAAGPW